MTETRISKRWTASAAATASALAVALPGWGAAPSKPTHPASVTTTTSRATRLHEYRQMIVGLYRVPGERPGEGPMDALRRSLETQYGAAPRPGPEV
jgi:hypothetical protein